MNPVDMVKMVECMCTLWLLPMDLYSKCSVFQAQLLPNGPRSQQLQYLPEHGMHHIQVLGHSRDLFCTAQKQRVHRIL